MQIIDKRITIMAGLSGSGKTSLAVNLALYYKKKNPDKQIALADLDIVNPYFRANDSAELLTKNGISVITSAYANTNLDAPAMPQDTQRLFDDKNITGIIDVGGDDRGALAIGRYSADIANEPDKNILLVINCYRPFTKTVSDIIRIKTEIETAAHFMFTGIINNSNIARQTTRDDILSSAELVNSAADALGLPVLFTAADERLKPPDLPDVFYINPYLPNILNRKD